MEYGENLYDFGYIKHVGYESKKSDCIEKYFSKNTIRIISYKVSELLQGVDPKDRKIIVPDETICSVMNDIYDSYRPPTGDIYSRYTIPSGETSESYVQNMIDQVIEVITSDVRNNIGMEECNKKLNIWDTLYGDFNDKGLRQHAPIKVLNKRPSSFQFNMNY